MNFKTITGTRGSGVSTQLVLESSLSRAPILCMYYPSKRHLLDRAAELGVTIPEPLTIGEFNDRGLIKPKRIIIDDASFVLENLLGSQIHAIGATIE